MAIEHGVHRADRRQVRPDLLLPQFFADLRRPQSRPRQRCVSAETWA